MSENIEQQVKQIVCQVTGLPADFDPNQHLYLDLGVASVHALQLLMEIEDKFGVGIPDEEFVEATSLKQLSEMVQRLVPQGSGN